MPCLGGPGPKLNARANGEQESAGGCGTALDLGFEGRGAIGLKLGKAALVFSNDAGKRGLPDRDDGRIGGAVEVRGLRRGRANGLQGDGFAARVARAAGHGCEVEAHHASSILDFQSSSIGANTSGPNRNSPE